MVCPPGVLITTFRSPSHTLAHLHTCTHTHTIAPVRKTHLVVPHRVSYVCVCVCVCARACVCVRGGRPRARAEPNELATSCLGRPPCGVDPDPDHSM